MHDESATLQVTLEGNLVNLDVTSPASTLALGLMFLKTNDARMAASFTVPGTRFALDFVRPDFIMLRVLARNLIMWDAMRPTDVWLSSQLPDIIKVPRILVVLFGIFWQKAVLRQLGRIRSILARIKFR